MSGTSSPTSLYHSAEKTFEAMCSRDPEPPLDRAIRARDQAFRCWIEEGNPPEKYRKLKEKDKLAYKRLPVVLGSGLPSGTYFIRTYNNQAVEITAAQALKHPMFAFQAQ